MTPFLLPAPEQVFSATLPLGPLGHHRCSDACFKVSLRRKHKCIQLIWVTRVREPEGGEEVRFNSFRLQKKEVGCRIGERLRNGRAGSQNQVSYILVSFWKKVPLVSLSTLQLRWQFTGTWIRQESITYLGEEVPRMARFAFHFL